MVRFCFCDGLSLSLSLPLSPVGGEPQHMEQLLVQSATHLRAFRLHEELCKQHVRISVDKLPEQGRIATCSPTCPSL